MNTEEIKQVYKKSKLKKTANTFRKIGKACADNEIAEELVIMADVLDNCVERGEALIEPEKSTRNQIEKKLARRGIRVKDIGIFIQNDMPMEVILQAKTAKRANVNSKEIENVLGDVLECQFEGVDGNRRLINEVYHDYMFRQMPRYQILMGHVMKVTNGQNFSGDNFSSIEMENGKIAVTISDGMGSGEIARKESSVALELLEHCLEAGFEAKNAIGLANAALYSKSESRHPVTVDMCVVDKYLGVADFIKLGAAATFIKRDGYVEIIRSTSLPIGVLEKTDYDCASKKLYDEDLIIMISDGVLENLLYEDKEERLVKLIESIDIKAPGIFAQTLMEMVSNEKQQRNDDMSILVIGVFDTIMDMY